MKKIVIVDSSIDITGSYMCALMIVKLLSLDSLVELIVPYGSKERIIRFNEISNSNCKIIETHFPILRRKGSSIISYPIKLILFSFWMKIKLKKFNCDAVLFNDINFLCLTMGKILRWKGVILVWMRSHPELYGKNLANIYFRDIFYSKAKLICVSNVINNKIPLYLNSTVIYDAIDTHQFSFNVLKNNNFIMLANYIPGKGQELAIKALSILIKKGIFVRINFYGSTMGRPKNKLFLEQLKDEVKKLGLENFTTFSNQVRPDINLYKGVLAALSLSKLEALSMSVMEACAAGIPVISTKSGGPEEIIIDGINGYLIPIDDFSSLASKMEKFLVNKNLSIEMGISAIEQVKNKFSPNDLRIKLSNILF
jgi:glycosyltransferase involved in cell wall biosynthesis